MSVFSAQQNRTGNLTLTLNCVEKAVKSLVLSKKFMKIITRTTIINLLYHRLNLDEKNFTVKTFRNVEYRVYKKVTDCQIIMEYLSSMRGFEDAINNNYIKSLTLYFVNSNTKAIIEYYKFDISFYPDYLPKKSTKKEERDLIESSKEETRKFLDALNHFKTFEKLQDNYINVKLELAFSEKCPEGYKPPGFRPLNEGEISLHERRKTDLIGINNALLGNIYTGFNKFRCKGRCPFLQAALNEESNNTLEEIGDLNEEEDEEEEEEVRVENNEKIYIIPSENSNHSEDMDLEVMDEAINQKKIIENNAENVQDDIIVIDDSPGDNTEFSFNTKLIPSFHSSERDFDMAGNVKCVCNIPDSSIRMDAVKCIKCINFFHCPCVGYLNLNSMGSKSDEFICDFCIIGRLPQNADESEKISSTARLKYALASIYQYNNIPEKILPFFRSTLTLMLEKQYIISGKNDDLHVTDPTLIKIIFK